MLRIGNLDWALADISQSRLFAVGSRAGAQYFVTRKTRDGGFILTCMAAISVNRPCPDRCCSRHIDCRSGVGNRLANIGMFCSSLHD